MVGWNQLLVLRNRPRIVALYLLEKEVVLDELLLGSRIHTLEWVESTLEIAFEGLSSLGDLLHDLKSLSLGDTWTKRVALEVSANSDSSRVDHGGVLFGELSVLKTLGLHVRSVGSIGLVAVVLLNDLIEEFVELGVSVMRSSVETDSGVKVLDSREDAGLEGDTFGTALVLVLFPDLLSQGTRKSRVGLTSWEESGVVHKLIR